jgi:hypothetical protein
MAKNADKCATLRQARQLQSGALNWVFGRKWPKTPMFVPLCSARTRTLRNKNGQKSPFLSQLVSRGRSHAETKIASLKN